MSSYGVEGIDLKLTVSEAYRIINMFAVNGNWCAGILVGWKVTYLTNFELCLRAYIMTHIQPVG